MERETFQTPEQSAAADNGETSKDSSKKKKAAETAPLLIKLSTAESKPDDAKQQASGSLWERMANMVVPKPEEKKTDQTDASPKTAEAAETEADDSLGTLSEEEKRELVRTGVEARGEAIAQEQSELAADTPEEYAAAAAEAFVDNVQDQLKQGDASEAEPVDDVIERAYQETVEDFAPEAAHATAPPFNEADEPPARAVDHENDDTAFPVAAQQGAGGTGGQPPRAGFGYAGFNMSPGQGGSRPLWERYAAMPSDVEADAGRSRSNIGGVLVGGIIGYLLGRRAGRIKTERVLKPVQEKLEREVKALYGNLAQKEQRIRRLAAAEKRPAPARAEAIAAQPERLSPVPQTAERRSGIPALRAEAVDVNTLPLAEVLAMSENITVGATNLREIHATNLISERGLRRVVSEFLRGGEFLPVLSAEIASKERDHEIDPRLRDRPPEVAGGVNGGRVAPLRPDAPAAQERAAGQLPAAVHTSRSDMPSSGPLQTPRAIVIANVVALAVLGVLVLVLAAIWLSR